MASVVRAIRNVRAKARSKLTQYGQEITRHRPTYEDAYGFQTQEPDITFNAVVGGLHRHQAGALVDEGLMNANQMDQQSVMFDDRVDIQVGDELAFNGLRWRVLRVLPQKPAGILVYSEAVIAVFDQEVQ